MQLQGQHDHISSFRQGDRDVLTALYRTHLPAVEKLLRHGFTFTSKGNTVRFQGYQQPFALQEAIQDGFLHAFRLEARHQYDGDKPYRPFLITVIRNHIIDKFRKEQTHARYFVALADIIPEATTEEEVLSQLASEQTQTSPEQTSIQYELQQTLKTFLDTLDSKDQTLIEEHFMGTMTQTEIAQEIGESRNDVRKRIRNLRSKLLRHLKSQGLIESLDASELFRSALVFLLVGRAYA